MSAPLDNYLAEPRVAVLRPGLLVPIFSFLGIGGSAALLFVVLSGFVVSLNTGLPDWIASAFCYALFIIPVYLMHRRFSFRSTAPHARALPRYIATQMGGLALASLFSYVAYSAVGLPTLVAATVVIGATSAVNFLVLRLWAFADAR